MKPLFAYNLQEALLVMCMARQAYDEYVDWNTLGFTPVQAPDPCATCGKDFFTLSGTCLTCKSIREGMDMFVNLCKSLAGVWWASLDDTSKRFMLMELS